jgi:hypothetical protein
MNGKDFESSSQLTFRVRLLGSLLRRVADACLTSATQILLLPTTVDFSETCSRRQRNFQRAQFLCTIEGNEYR